MDLTTAIDWSAERRNAVLITLRKDGRAQSSDIAFTVKDGTFAISITESRAKTTNMRRDPRVVLHLTDPGSWTYLSFDGTVELLPATTAIDDATNYALVDYFEAVSGAPHPNWDEYRQAMVDEGRLLAMFTPISVVGQIH
ncbi:MAG: PPOX class probable F420-dependent enzyme [Verrucomicrobiales bacterium]|jgi:PPOX class probable F420-dependent enzyme